jgi:hypothetical protein
VVRGGLPGLFHACVLGWRLVAGFSLAFDEYRSNGVVLENQSDVLLSVEAKEKKEETA